MTVAGTLVKPYAAKGSMMTMVAYASCVVDTNSLIYSTVMGSPCLTVLDEPIDAADSLRELVRGYQTQGKSIHRSPH